MKWPHMLFPLCLAACSQADKSAGATDTTNAPAAQVVATTAAPAEITMHSIGELSPPDEATSELQGALPANPKDWPASMYSHTVGGGSCTSTLVGARALLTAAHCVPDGGAVRFSLAGVAYRAACEHAAEYKNDATADYALCLVDKPVTGVKFERVNSAPSALKLGQQLTLTGYGCTTSAGTGGNDNIYRIGPANITVLPKTNNDIVTEGQAALCFGDSGGPAFLAEAGGKRKVTSVNSRIGVQGETLTKTSYLSSTSTATAQTFITGWSSRNAAPICGIQANAADCR